MPSALPAQAPHRPSGQGLYQKHIEDPVLTELEDRDKKAKEDAQALTKKIEDEQEPSPRRRRRRARTSASTGPASSNPRPLSLQSPELVLPPVAQYLTGTCWSFSTTSFYESEIKRLSGKEIKLSEMWTAYCEYPGQGQTVHRHPRQLGIRGGFGGGGGAPRLENLRRDLPRRPIPACVRATAGTTTSA